MESKTTVREEGFLISALDTTSGARIFQLDAWVHPSKK
jgi:hypothetical protein